VAAPLGGMTLAQLGADVIHVDPVGGAADTTRWPPAPSGASLYWTVLNKGKRSVTLALLPCARKVEHRAIVLLGDRGALPPQPPLPDGGRGRAAPLPSPLEGEGPGVRGVR
jgi:hypothetical protein